MRLILFTSWILAIHATLTGCKSLETTTAAPHPISIPAPVVTPDIARTEAQVRKVEDKVDEVEDAVREVGNQLDAARTTARSLEQVAEEAYANGLEAGSAAATELKEFVASLQVELTKSIEAREAAMVRLAETKAELDNTEKANLTLRSEIEAIAAQNSNLIERLDEANARIQIGIKIAQERDEAKLEVAKVEQQRDAARKYVWGVWIGVAIVATFVILKIIVKAGKWTPQGRAASFLFN